jgi:hypothetical protein
VVADLMAESTITRESTIYHNSLKNLLILTLVTRVKIIAAYVWMKSAGKF